MGKRNLVPDQKITELMSVFSVDSQDIFEAWKVYRGLLDAGLPRKLAIRQMARMYPKILTPEVRDYLTALMLETITKDMIRGVVCG